MALCPPNMTESPCLGLNAVRDPLCLRATVKLVPGNGDDLASAEKTEVRSAACQCALSSPPPLPSTPRRAKAWES